jgi:hypothetical protein
MLDGDLDDYRCRGCGRFVCTPCVMMFGHETDGAHSCIGDLRRSRDGWEADALRHEKNAAYWRQRAEVAAADERERISKMAEDMAGNAFVRFAAALRELPADAQKEKP